MLLIKLMKPWILRMEIKLIQISLASLVMRVIMKQQIIEIMKKRIKNPRMLKKNSF